MADMATVVCKAPINMAVLKYWGKRDENLILPLHDSLSATLHIECMASSITVTASNQFDQDQMTLNGKVVEMKGNARLQAVIQGCRAIAGPAPESLGGDWSRIKLHLECSNDFPTAAGLASSASGYACLTAALSELYHCKEAYPGQLSAIARQGSGSACRSMYGGFVEWMAGSAADGRDSIAVQIAPESHWAQMRVLILVVSVGEKATGSSIGMQRSTSTSTLLPHRSAEIVPKRIRALSSAIVERDFQSFAELTMKDSNQFHAICADSFPPIFYLNSTSHAIIDAVHKFNEAAGGLVAAYTFDAGPNACIFTLDQNLGKLSQYLLDRFCPIAKFGEFVHDPLSLCPLPPTLNSALFINDSRVNRMIITKVGPGPIARHIA
uniref:Diphosphomevalonate decarboxylase n=1 Tax=Spongospora subterranea TaxID=70186 RepID=A0A0H5QW61_9EUKA|eukprot:CRZ06160.1 hypothetical protein [Spongospora subterranea]